MGKRALNGSPQGQLKFQCDEDSSDGGPQRCPRATQYVRGCPFWFVFSLEKREGGDTHTQFGRTRRLPGGEEHHQPRQHPAQKTSRLWAA